MGEGILNLPVLLFMQNWNGIISFNVKPHINTWNTPIIIYRAAAAYTADSYPPVNTINKITPVTTPKMPFEFSNKLHFMVLDMHVFTNGGGYLRTKENTPQNTKETLFMRVY